MSQTPEMLYQIPPLDRRILFQVRALTFTSETSGPFDRLQGSPISAKARSARFTSDAPADTPVIGRRGHERPLDVFIPAERRHPPLRGSEGRTRIECPPHCSGNFVSRDFFALVFLFGLRVQLAALSMAFVVFCFSAGLPARHREIVFMIDDQSDGVGQNRLPRWTARRLTG